ncbi:uracil phosphoribosyltransferase-domain-containing protein [Baffinella frigidus]|nr:uracil phosphoribosyltransferase-domain-containing protein [Cryptophyta sp. CCMP2293]
MLPEVELRRFSRQVATAFPSEAHARSAGGDGWYVKPWNSFQAAPETPDTVPGYERVHVFRRTNYTISLFTTLRDRATGTAAFTEASGKLAGLLLNEALALLPFTPTAVVTPVDGATYLGMRLPDPETEVCVVSVLRAADSISDVAMRMLPGVSVGKLLIQRDEKTAQPTLSYCKLPHDIASRKLGGLA